MDELHLAEINNLYKKSKEINASSMPIVPSYNYDYIFDNRNNDTLARVAAFYNKIADDNDSIHNAIINKWTLEPYYYGGIAKPDGTIANSYTVRGSDDGRPHSDTFEAKFLPNYNLHTRMHGIPYVKGPFIEHDPNSQKYKLRWV